MSIIKIGATCLALFTCGVASADDSDMMGINVSIPLIDIDYDEVETISVEDVW